VGGLEVAGLLNLVRFFKLAFSMRKVAMEADGNISVDLFRHGRVFYVASIWRSEDEMRAFAQSGEHGEIMRNGLRLIKSSKNVSYTATTLPTRAEVVARWKNETE
jgi:heme-degrading monooxygenase HmoA